MDTRSLVACGVVFALLPASCGNPTSSSDIGETNQAITSGAPDDTDTSTVLIVAKVGRSVGFCSGVVVSPHVVLTAAHCTTQEAEYSIFIGANYNDSASRAHVGNIVPATEHHPHPDHDFSFNTNDIGVLIAATPLSRTAALLNRKPLGKIDVGRAIRIVGYGQTSGASREMGRRMEGKTTIGAIDETTITVMGLPNTCLFDSGGPTFMTRDGQEVIVGIHFIIDSVECNSKGTDVRVDPYADFVDKYVRAFDPLTKNPADTDAGADAGLDASSSDSAATVAAAPTSGCTIGGAQRSSTCAGLYGLFASAMLVQRRSARRGESRERIKLGARSRRSVAVT